MKTNLRKCFSSFFGALSKYGDLVESIYSNSDPLENKKMSNQKSR